MLRFRATIMAHSRLILITRTATPLTRTYIPQMRTLIPRTVMAIHGRISTAAGAMEGTGTHIIAPVSVSAFAGAVAVTMVVVIMVMDITAAVLTTALVEGWVLAPARGPSWALAAASTLSGAVGTQLPS